ncbi:MAG TPA: four helix bundle protein [Pyrinomonadaceae bacterium]|nr:four helix bundle protein [Pyrinomonadaceae bacterium]
MRDFRELKVWGKAHSLTLEIYRCTSTFPKAEMYGLTSQLRRASSSIPANIAEGCGRGGNKELARFLQIGMGSASELEYHILLAHDLSYLQDLNYYPLQTGVVEVKRMLTSLHQRVQGN